MTAEASPLVRLEDVHRVYRTGDVEVHALRGVDVSIRRGDFVAIVGASGSGKSTAMHLIGLLDRPTRGRVYLDGRDVSSLSVLERADMRLRTVGFVFQSYNLLPRTSALENVELPLLYSGVRTSERHARAREAIGLVGLGDRASSLPSQLSGGQQQRIAIARALVNRPPLLLADEPTGNLDSRTSLEILALLQDLNRREGVTIVLVTHEHDIADCARRLLAFRDGKIVRDEPIPRPTDASQALATMPALG